MWWESNRPPPQLMPFLSKQIGNSYLCEDSHEIFLSFSEDPIAGFDNRCLYLSVQVNFMFFLDDRAFDGCVPDTFPQLNLIRSNLRDGSKA
jgi:hypothetical protein